MDGVCSAENSKVGPPRAGRAIARLAGHQHGVVASFQLRALGLDRHSITRLIRAGWLHPIHRGVYAVGHRSLTAEGRYMAAVLATGPRAALSHRSAAAIWGLRPSSGRPEVTAPRGGAGLRGLTVHRSRVLEPRDVTSVEAIPVTTVARTLLDLAGTVPATHLAKALDRAERLRLFDLGAVEEVLSRARGKRGAAALRDALALYRPSHTRSELEDRFAELVRRAGLPAARLNALVDGERATHEVDAYWPEHGLAVQLDGFAYHHTRRDRERDAECDLDLELVGLRLLRLTWDDVTARASRTLRRLRLPTP